MTGYIGDDARGYFPRGESLLRRVHETRIVGLLYGQRALLMQACNPLAFAGLAARTKGAKAPFARLARTAKTMERVFFGSRSQADYETARVRELHALVHGQIDRQEGPFPPGTRYDASDPEFLLWILACLADSALCVYEHFVQELTDAEREAFWQDYLLLGELFGLPRSKAPSTYAEFRDYMRRRLESPDLAVTEMAREAGCNIVLAPPVPELGRPIISMTNLAVVGMLPARVRQFFGLSWGSTEERVFRALTIASRTASRVLPARWQRGTSAWAYEAIAQTHAAQSRTLFSEAGQ